MSDLALLGGPPVRTAPLPASNTIGAEEKAAVLEVLDSGVLSGFVGAWTDEFYGGPWVQRCERAYRERLGVKHAISVNSATTGLEVALAGAGVGPGDEVIVSPYTMSATAAAVLARNAIPVFADVEDRTFGLDPASVAGLINERTRAIAVVHLFGHPARMGELLELAARHRLAVIEDAAQSIGATYEGRESGTLGDVGVLSLNRHKIIQCGEGGIVLTDDDRAARIAAMVRNHGEAVVEAEGGDPLDTLGSNYRMSELQAAIATTQLAKLDGELEIRRRLAARLSERLGARPELVPAVTEDDCTHSFYVYPMRLRDAVLEEVPREIVTAALRAEGIAVSAGYVRPLYLQPLYQQRLGRGSRGCPWTCGHWQGEVSYERGICPVAERLHDSELLLADVVRSPLRERDVDDVADAFEKVLDGLGALRSASLSG